MLNLIKNNTIEDKTYVIDKSTKNTINKWLKYNNLDNITIKELFTSLGIIPQSKILLIKNKDNNIILSINNNYLLELSSKRIINIYNNNSQTKYFCTKDIDNNLKLYQELDTYKENINGIYYYQTLSIYGISINIIFPNNTELILNCQGHFNFQKDKLNDLKLYLIKCNQSQSIYEIYKNITKIYLTNENIYSKLDLSIKKDNQLISNINYQKEDIHPIFTKERIFTIKDNNYISYKKELSKDNIYNAKLINNDYKLELYFKLDSLNNNPNEYNEIILRDYLLNIKFPLDIEELYQNIKRISLSHDLDKYPNIKIDIYYKNELISTLHLFYGNITSYKEEQYINNKVRKLTK